MSSSEDGGRTRIIYSRADGSLSYDPDGAGEAAPVRFAVVAGAPPLTASDFLLI